MAAPLLPEDQDGCFGFSLGGEVTLDLLQDALERFSGVLDVLRESHDANIDWVVAGLEHGSISAAVRAVPIDDSAAPKVSALCHEYLDAATSIQRGQADFTFPLHRQMYQLAQLADEAHPLAIATDGEQVEIQESISLKGFEGPKQYVTFGTLRGRVETLSRHQQLNFRLYESSTGHSVICHMNPDTEETMRDVWGYIADVTGTISRDSDTDRPRSMKSITSVEPVEEGGSGGWRRARGALRSKTPAETLIGRLRDDG